jgi:hypothetical protein
MEKGRKTDQALSLSDRVNDIATTVCLLFELLRVMQLSPNGFPNQTDQSIRNGIRR